MPQGIQLLAGFRSTAGAADPARPAGADHQAADGSAWLLRVLFLELPLSNLPVIVCHGVATTANIADQP